MTHLLNVNTRVGRFGSKVGQIGPKWDKSGAFSDQKSEPNLPTLVKTAASTDVTLYLKLGHIYWLQVGQNVVINKMNF